VLHQLAQNKNLDSASKQKEYFFENHATIANLVDIVSSQGLMALNYALEFDLEFALECLLPKTYLLASSVQMARSRLDTYY